MRLWDKASLILLWPWRCVCRIALIFVKRVVFSLSEREHYKNVLLVSGFRNSEAFFYLIRSSLDLLHAADERRYYRVINHIKVIEHAIHPYRSHYNHYVKSCGIDYDGFVDENDLGRAKIEVAFALVHEATHALLRFKGFRPVNGRFARTERICVREELYLARRLKDKAHDWEEIKREKLEKVNGVDPPSRLKIREFRQLLVDIWRS